MENSTHGNFECSPLPKKDCIFYVQYGTCSYGRNCKYNHSPREDSQVVQKESTENMCTNYTRKNICKFFRAGFCKYGTYCNFIHSIPKPPTQYNSDGLPMRLDKPTCLFYMRNHRCDYGVGCKFHHPELYFPPQEYGSHDSGQVLEYHEGCLAPVMEHTIR
ncbi:zinc finger CCCH domain-containing protein 8-like [Bidens hawaiensis]|uniref:zinc finger CCCH domain-containing protein 8-like n=1 Tax=Bidens hawaiensis TaxID=980011 RepID=UPI0040491743